MKIKKGDSILLKIENQWAVDILNNGGGIEFTKNDIIKVTPEAFNWKDVKPGMAFKNDLYSLFYYIGTDPSGRLVFDMQESQHPTRYSSFGVGFDGLILAGIERVPEYDVEVKK